MADGYLGHNLKFGCSFNDHQTVKGFSENQCRGEAGESAFFNALEEPTAEVRIFSRTGEVVNKDVGINKDFSVIWKVYWHGGVYES